MIGFKTHRDTSIDVWNTHKFGTLVARPEQVQKAFGAPLVGLFPQMVTMDWHLLFDDGTVATVYDYVGPVVPGEPYHWSIGSTSREGVELVHAAFRERLGLGEHRAA